MFEILKSFKFVRIIFDIKTTADCILMNLRDIEFTAVQENADTSIGNSWL